MYNTLTVVDCFSKNNYCNDVFFTSIDELLLFCSLLELWSLYMLYGWRIGCNHSHTDPLLCQNHCCIEEARVILGTWHSFSKTPEDTVMQISFRFFHFLIFYHQSLLYLPLFFHHYDHQLREQVYLGQHNEELRSEQTKPSDLNRKKGVQVASQHMCTVCLSVSYRNWPDVVGANQLYYYMPTREHNA